MTQLFFISVVDDDEAIRQSLEGLLASMGFGVESFPSAEAFLDSPSLTRTGCLVLDMRMPGMSGIDLQRELVLRGNHVPTIFISADCDVRLRRRVIAEGAVACLRKPFSDEELLRAIERCRTSGTTRTGE